MKTKIILPLTVAALGFASTCAQAAPLPANLVTNGSFEDDFSGWSTSSDFFISEEAAHTGVQSAQTGCGGSGCVATSESGAFIAQTIGTGAGASYALSFWVMENGGPPAALSVFWDGRKIATVAEPAPIGSGFVAYTFDGLVASGASTTFELHGRQDAASIFFDDVAVVSTDSGEGSGGSVPEPGSLALLGLGMAGFTAARHRTRR